MRRERRVRDEHGFVLPTRLMVFSISAVALAGLLFVATHDGGDGDVATPAAARPTEKSTPSPADDATTAPEVVVTPTVTAKPRPPVRRNQVFVVVFNNSNVKGLAGKTASRAQGAGWNVVGSDNWYGTVDTSTVYFGPKLKDAATMLAKDLGITSVKPAVDPMRADRVTVILTADYS